MVLPTPNRIRVVHVVVVHDPIVDIERIVRVVRIRRFKKTTLHLFQHKFCVETIKFVAPGGCPAAIGAMPLRAVLT